ncbi:MAG: hypothetical protein AB1757_09530 [Acidobacteriota bacterium]
MNQTNRARRTILGLATWVLICFFLPWVQLSCMGISDSVSGFDLARAGDRVLWLVPLLMLVIVVLGLARWLWEKLPALFALTATVGGGFSAYLMYAERLSLNDSPKLIATQWTAVFWLGFLAALGIVATAFWFYARQIRAP